MQKARVHFHLLLLFTLAIFSGLLANGALAQEKFPNLTGRVVDVANLITPATKVKLIDMLAAFEAKSSDQLVVATIVSLEGQPLEEYSNLLFRHWELGQAEENNGVLLLIAKNDRKIRIEVGYGLEGELTDLRSKLIIENIIVPSFRAGKFSDGIFKGAEQIIKVLSGNSEELNARAKRTNQPSNFSAFSDPELWPVYIFVLIFLSFVIFSILASIFGKKIGPGHYRWLGIDVNSGGGGGSGGSSGSGGGWSGGSSGGGFSGGGGSSGGGGASGSW